jgi:hypothetical protein
MDPPLHVKPGLLHKKVHKEYRKGMKIKQAHARAVQGMGRASALRILKGPGGRKFRLLGKPPIGITGAHAILLTRP